MTPSPEISATRRARQITTPGRVDRAMTDVDAALAFLAPDETGRIHTSDRTRAPRRASARISRLGARLRFFQSFERRRYPRVARSVRADPRVSPRVSSRAGAALLARVLTDPMLTGIPFVDAHGALRPGQLLEVCGVGGSGKTEILMQAAVHAVMPRKRGGVAFGGCEASVLLIDLDGKFDTLRLIKILTAKIRDTVDDASARAHGSSSRDDQSRRDAAGASRHPFPGFHPSSSQRERRPGDAPRRWDHPYGHDEGPPPRSDADRSALRDRVYVECMGRFQTLRCHCSLDF